MAIKLLSHLHRARSGVLHFRIAIPPDLRHYFGLAEIYRSLHTPTVSIAASAAQALTIALKRVFHELRQEAMSDLEKEPTGPAIDRNKLLRHARQATQRHRLQEEQDRHQDEINALYRRINTQAAQHERELGLVLQARHSLAAPLPMLVATPAAPATPLLSQTIADFIRHKVTKDGWTAKTEHENRAIYELFIRIISDQPIDGIDDEVILDYLDKLKKLPANINKKPSYLGKSIEELISLAPKPMATRTINKNIERVSSLFKWALTKKKYCISQNPAAGMSLKENEEPRRQPFDSADLIALFSADEFSNRKFENPYTYWLMPLGLLTGARLGEICQLYLSDFVVFNGIHCINISDNEEYQRLKTPNARRLVPIHEKLIDLGLLRYVEHLRRIGETRLFPEISPRRDGLSQAASNWFGRYKIKCGIYEKHTKVFHSFRHTFISSLLDDEVAEHAVAQIVGHEGGLITSRVYWNKRDASKRKPTVEMYQPPEEVWRLVPSYEAITITGSRN